MFKVECPGCNAPYQVDERRVPSTGLKMRCPKCGDSFKVEAPSDARRTGPTPVLGAAPAEAPVAAGAARPPPARGLKTTVLGVAPGAQGAPRAAPPAPTEAKLPEPLAPAGDPYGEVDLPAIGGGAEGRKPAPAAPAVPDEADFGDLDLDLPALAQPAVARPKTQAIRSPLPPALDPQFPSDEPGSFGDIDLPAPAAASRPAAPRHMDFGEVDLPSIGPARPNAADAADLGDIDLPAVGATGRGSDLPAPASSGFGELHLPSVARASDLPAVGGIDLPSAGGLDLPAKGRADLPQTAGGLPSTAGTGLPSPAGNLPAPGGTLPMRGGTGSGLPTSRAQGPQPRRDSVGELDLQAGQPAATGARPGRTVPLADAGSAAVVRQSGGGVAYGEVNLDASGDLPVPEASQPDDDMEFGAIPQERQAPERAAPAAAAMPAPAAQPLVAPAPTSQAGRAARPRRRGRRIAIGLLALAVVGGGALALVPSAGPFGVYKVMDHLRGGEYQALIADTVKSARQSMARDTYPDAKAALQTVSAARARAKRVHTLAAYEAYVGYESELRFGAEPAVSARAQVLLKELADAREVEHLALARAAGAAASGQLARARQELVAMSSSRPRDIDVAVLRGEVELRAREPKAALEAWQRAAALEQSARTAHGLARARFAGGDVAGAEQDAHTALQQNPGHVGSRILLARIAWATSQKEKRALELLEQITAAPNRASPDEKVSAQTLLGAIHLARSRITHAENAYDAALQIDPKAAGALTGLGEALYRAGRYSEALARFEAGIQADPDDLTAKIGVAKTKLMLERPDDAEAMMKKLREAHPKSGLVAYWHGRVLEALGSREDAERAYRDAIALGDSLDVVDAFVALALVLNQSGKAEEAQDLLSDARGKLPQSPAIHKALGELALTQGRYTDAVDEIRRALELDPSDVGAKFMLGVARRRTREFDEATRIFDEVAAVDRDYPGLALERGVLHEAAGRTQEALQAYETALAKAPNDPDLMLRVGCGKVSAGAGKQALELLRKVLAQRPNSAETNHCVGRALLAEGTNLAEALRALERAVELDANRAEYHLYVGWAANEAGRVARAESALKRALELDQGLADAYWQRGVLRARQGAVKDAVQDLNRALELRPSRYEAHATLADAYYDLGREPAAINEWHKAVTADPNQPLWRFRYGKLLLANRKNEAAAEHLGKAIELTDATDPKPRWLWEAHHLMARALGPRADAAPHWKAFLRDGPRDSPYRGEAKAALEKLGQRWDGD